MVPHYRPSNQPLAWILPAMIIWILVCQFFIVHELNYICFLIYHTHFFVDSNKTVANKKQTPEKGPVMLLYELFNDVQIDCVSSDGVQHSRFKMVATVNNQKFEGTGN